jgi:hypothetical protein
LFFDHETEWRRALIPLYNGGMGTNIKSAETRYPNALVRSYAIMYP